MKHRPEGRHQVIPGHTIGASSLVLQSTGCCIDIWCVYTCSRYNDYGELKYIYSPVYRMISNLCPQENKDVEIIRLNRQGKTYDKFL